jgi:protein tyrosine phosphatase
MGKLHGGHRKHGRQGKNARTGVFDRFAKTVKGRRKSLDPIWQNPSTNATIYVGDKRAARKMEILQTHNISHVVNCTDNMRNFHKHSIIYHRFDIGSLGKSSETTVSTVRQMLEFVGTALICGQNVMVHCNAGAHRAGTTGVICLMHFANLGKKAAIARAKACRPVIDPTKKRLPEILHQVEKGMR